MKTNTFVMEATETSAHVEVTTLPTGGVRLTVDLPTMRSNVSMELSYEHTKLLASTLAKALAVSVQ